VLFELAEVGIDARLNGPFPKQPGAEGVDRPDEGPLEPGQGGLDPFSDRRVPLLEPGLLQRDLEPSPELRRRLAGEGDGGQRLDPRPSRAEQGDHPADQARGLSRSRPGLDQECRVEVVHDPVAGWLVGRGRPFRAHHLYPASLS
jgi:hypothetical protein